MLTGNPIEQGTPFPSNPYFSGYDPIAIGYMTQGQMGYMPQQQYLTPAGYGAFRTMPSNTGYGQAYHRPSFFQNIAYANNGFVGPIPVPTYNPAVDMVTRQGQARMAIADDTIAFGATALDTAISAAAFLNPYTAVASMFMPNVGSYASDVLGQTRNIQRMTTPRINFGSDVNRLTGMGFSTSKAMGIEQFIRKSAAGDAFLKQEDYREIMKHGLENNLFDYSNSADAYKKVIKRLRNQTDVFLEVIDDKNLQGVMKNLKRMQDMGASGDISSNIIRQENMFARMTGMRHSDMVNAYGQQGALIFSQMGLTGYQGSLSAMGAAANLTVAQKLGLIDPGTLNRMGGTSGAVQRISEESGMMQKKIMEMLGPYFFKDGKYDKSRVDDVISGKVSITDAMSIGAKSLNDPTKKTAYDANKDRFTEELSRNMGQTLELLSAIVAKDYGNKANITDPKNAMIAGFKHLYQFSDETARLAAERYNSPEAREALMQNVLREQQAAREKDLAKSQQETLMSPFTKVASAAYNAFGDPIIKALNGITEAIEKPGASGSWVFNPGNYSGRPTDDTIDYGSKGGAKKIYIDPTTSDYKPDLSDIQALSKKHESSNGKDLIGYDDGGGTSYGVSQLSSTMGHIQGFLKETVADASLSEEERAWAKEMLGLQLNTGSKHGAAPALFLEGVKKGFAAEERQKDYLIRTHYNTALSNIAKKDPELAKFIEENPAIQQMVYSTAVQHGPNTGENRQGATGVLLDAWRDAGGDIEKFISLVYSYRGSRASDKAILPRMRAEAADALAAYREQTGVSPATGGGDGPEYFEWNDSVSKHFNIIRGGIDAKGMAPTSSTQSSIHDNAYESADVYYQHKLDSLKSPLSKVARENLFNTLRISEGSFNVTAESMLSDIGLFDENYDTKVTEFLKKLGISEEHLNNPDLIQMVRRKIAELNPALKDEARKGVGAYTAKENEFLRKQIDSSYTTTKDSLQEIFGSEVDNVLALQQSSNGSALDLIDIVSRASDNLDATTDATPEMRELAEKTIREKAARMGFSPEEIDHLVRTGNISGISRFDKGFSDSIHSYSRIARKNKYHKDGTNKLEDASMTFKAMDIASADILLRKVLDEQGLTMEDIDSIEERSELLKSGRFDGEFKNFLEVAEANRGMFGKKGGKDNIAGLQRVAMEVGLKAIPHDLLGGDGKDGSKTPEEIRETSVLLNDIANDSKRSADALEHLAGRNKPIGHQEVKPPKGDY